VGLCGDLKYFIPALKFLYRSAEQPETQKKYTKIKNNGVEAQAQRAIINKKNTDQ